MIAESVLLELRTFRRFRTVAGALRWWSCEVLRRQSVCGAVPDVFVSCSRAAFDVRDATFARIVACLALRAPEDTDSDRKLTPRRIAKLLAWYDSEEQQPRGTNQAARKTRNQIRRRMANRGLLEESEGPKCSVSYLLGSER